MWDWPRRSFAGIRLWPAVALVWAIRALMIAAPAAALGAVWLARPDWRLVGLLSPVAALLTAGAVYAAREYVPYDLPAGLRLRYALAVDGHWPTHAALAARIGRRRPAAAERLLRRGLAAGHAVHYEHLAELLRRQGRADELEPVRARLIADGADGELWRVVSVHDAEPAIAAAVQRAVVARRPDAPQEHERHAALLAESGALDDALAAHREAVRRRAGRPPLPSDVRLLARTARALAAAGRHDDAEAVLRSGAAVPAALLPLALLLHERGRTAEAEALLREHPERTHPAARFALFTLLQKAGRTAEAERLRPRGGWPQPQRHRGPDGTAGPAPEAWRGPDSNDVTWAAAEPPTGADGGLPSETGRASDW
jgi:tetratricopeptide (TPR) repeat protein